MKRKSGTHASSNVEKKQPKHSRIAIGFADSSESEDDFVTPTPKVAKKSIASLKPSTSASVGKLI